MSTSARSRKKACNEAANMGENQNANEAGDTRSHRGRSESFVRRASSRAASESARTQEALAELLDVSQAEVSKMERRSELYIGTLRKFIAAMNGELVLAARFADGVEVPIKLTGTEDAA